MQERGIELSLHAALSQTGTAALADTGANPEHRPKPADDTDPEEG